MYYYLISPDNLAVMGFNKWMSRVDLLTHPEDVILSRKRIAASVLVDKLPINFIQQGVKIINSTELRVKWNLESGKYGAYNFTRKEQIAASAQSSEELSNELKELYELDQQSNSSPYVVHGYHYGIKDQELVDLLNVTSQCFKSRDYNYNANKVSTMKHFERLYKKRQSQVVVSNLLKDERYAAYSQFYDDVMQSLLEVSAICIKCEQIEKTAENDLLVINNAINDVLQYIETHTITATQSKKLITNLQELRRKRKDLQNYKAIANILSTSFNTGLKDSVEDCLKKLSNISPSYSELLPADESYEGAIPTTGDYLDGPNEDSDDSDFDDSEDQDDQDDFADVDTSTEKTSEE